MSSAQPTQPGQRNGLFVLGAVLLIAGLAYVVWTNLQDPLQGKTPDILEQLTVVKTRAENGARLLKDAGIDGRRQYEDLQVEANGCIGYLRSVLDTGGGDEKGIREHLDRLARKCNSFRDWADGQLQNTGRKGSVEAINLDLAGLVTAILKLLDQQQADRRERVKASLNDCKLRGWQDIPGGQGALGNK
jgi:hypothetical protein